MASVGRWVVGGWVEAGSRTRTLIDGLGWAVLRILAAPGAPLLPHVLPGLPGAAGAAAGTALPLLCGLGCRARFRWTEVVENRDECSDSVEVALANLFRVDSNPAKCLDDVVAVMHAVLVGLRLADHVGYLDLPGRSRGG